MNTLQASSVEPVTSATQLAALLPPNVQTRLRDEPDLLWFKPTAAALRVLASIRDPRIWEHVNAVSINWEALLGAARRREYSRSVEVRLELAASLAGYEDARPSLRDAAAALDASNWAAFGDALRIVNGSWSR